jgi:hypothetical protein
MSLPRLVCPNDPQLLTGLGGHPVAVRVNDLALAAGAAANVRESGNALYCVIVEASAPLAELEFDAEHKGVPLAVMVPSMAKFRDVVPKLDLMRELNLRVYLPCDDAENLTAMRLLSSVGVHTGADFAKGVADWDALSDLMTYAVLGRVPHASIEPFTFIATNYDPQSYLDWGATQFDDPRRFLHLDENGRIALSRAALAAGAFAAQSVAELGESTEFPAIRARANAWREFFVDNHPCSACRAWRVCLGKFADDADGCADFFAEAIEVAVEHRRLRAAPLPCAPLWQP